MSKRRSCIVALAAVIGAAALFAGYGLTGSASGVAAVRTPTPTPSAPWPRERPGGVVPIPPAPTSRSHMVVPIPLWPTDAPPPVEMIPPYQGRRPAASGGRRVQELAPGAANVVPGGPVRTRLFMGR
jgi:hypothetical protein